MRKKFTYDLAKKELESGMVTVTGKLELYKGKAQVIVTHPMQLSFKNDKEVSSDQLPALESN